MHYAGDLVAGALIGANTGQAVAGLMDRLPSTPIHLKSRQAARSAIGTVRCGTGEANN